MCDILVVLQNAWFTDGQPKSHEEWLQGLWGSVTGQRLKSMLPDQADDVEVINASPRVGSAPTDSFPPDLEHIRAALTKYRPRVILGCGKLACNALRELRVEFITAPHPAWRQLRASNMAWVKETASFALRCRRARDAWAPERRGPA